MIEGKRRRKYSCEGVWKALEERRTKYSSGSGLYHTAYPFVSLALSFGLQQFPRDLEVSLHLQPLTFFTEEGRCRRFMELVRAWASHYPVPYAAAHSKADR